MLQPIRQLATSLIACTLLLATTGMAQASAVNILFYGNSYTQGYTDLYDPGGSAYDATKTVPELVRILAEAAGFDSPNVQMQAVGGANLGNHSATGSGWDFVVLQDLSTRPLSQNVSGADRNAHINDALNLYNDVAVGSPGVQAIMFETWARQAGHGDWDEAFYTGSNAHYPSGPSGMQADLREGYALSAAAINNDGGFATVAPVGSAWELANWQLLDGTLLHDTDGTHASYYGTLLAAMVIYGTIYDDANISSINLDGVFTSLLGFSDAQVYELADYAQTTLIPEPAGMVVMLVAGAGALFTRRRRVEWKQN